LYKVISISIMLFFLGTACSVSRRGEFTKNLPAGVNRKDAPIKSLADNNITGTGFFIKKAEVEIISGENTENIIATLKYNKKGEYLLSLKSKAGIEAVRAFIGMDTLLINDRINKILYYGKPDFIEKKFSIPAELIPLILGDFIPGNRDLRPDTICLNGKLDYLSVIDRLHISYEIDCTRSKLVSSVIESGNKKEIIKLRYSGFKATESGSFPSVVDVSGLPEELNIHVEINSVEIPWVGELDFIPGSKYERVEIK